MRFEFPKRIPGQIEYGIIYGVIAVLGLIAARFLPVSSFAPQCIFKAMSGLPCPTCGSTRSIVNLAHTHLFSAFVMNPLISTLFIGLIIGLIYSVAVLIFDLPRIRIILSDSEKNVMRVSALLIVLLNWIYLFFTLPTD